MKLFDEKFRDNKLKYLIQCGLATLSVFILLLLLDVMSNGVIAASLGASSFIAFTMPHAQASRPRYLVAGYIIGVISACLCSLLAYLLTGNQYFTVFNISSYVIFGALAVGLAIFLMVITNSEHPPAAALALGLVMDSCSHMAVIVAVVGIVSLSLIKAVLKPYMINLL